MKKALRIILLFLVLIIIFILVITLFLPKSYVVKRERRIPAPIDSVFKYATDFQHWDSWSTWNAADPEAQYKYSANTQGVGSWMAWEGKVVGTGKMTITNLIVNQELAYDLEFKEPFEAKSNGGMYFQGDQNETRIQWYDMGEASWPIGRIYGVMMDGTIGPEFEKGLARLDSVVMSHIVSSAPTPTE